MFTWFFLQSKEEVCTNCAENILPLEPQAIVQPRGFQFLSPTDKNSLSFFGAYRDFDSFIPKGTARSIKMNGRKLVQGSGPKNIS